MSIIIRKRSRSTRLIGGTLPPSPPCTIASVFADCFTGCVGVLAAPPDPPVCGWSYDSGGGTATFDGDEVSIATDGLGSEAIIFKSVLGAPGPEVSMQFRFTEYPVDEANNRYLAALTGALAVEVLSVFFNGPTVLVSGGAGGSVMIGAWTPVAGSTHTVHMTRDAVGVPTLTIDGVPIALAFLFPGPLFGFALALAVVIDSQHNSGAPSSQSWDYVFANDGLDPDSTVYCCPEGGPAA